MEEFKPLDNVDLTLNSSHPVGPGWEQTRRGNWKKVSRGKLIVLFPNIRYNRNPHVQWGYGIDGVWSAAEYNYWEDAEKAALNEVLKLVEYEKSL